MSESEWGARSPPFPTTCVCCYVISSYRIAVGNVVLVTGRNFPPFHFNHLTPTLLPIWLTRDLIMAVTIDVILSKVRTKEVDALKIIITSQWTVMSVFVIS
eukprot:SAG11_NODE_1865_length_4153_cov_8.490133_2_plen_101_part_00